MVGGLECAIGAGNVGRYGDMRSVALGDAGEVQEYLFDLRADPQEKNNLLSERAQTVLRWKQRLRHWEDEGQSLRRRNKSDS